MNEETTNTEQTSEDAIACLVLAKFHAEYPTKNEDAPAFARLCVSDAIECFKKKDYYYCIMRCLKSLAYSVGVEHPDYLLVKQLIEDESAYLQRQLDVLKIGELIDSAFTQADGRSKHS